jgi:ribosomal protein S18 acetylase RimI-like enzyme
MFQIRKIEIEDFSRFNSLLKMIESESSNMLRDPNERTTTDEDQKQSITRILSSTRSSILVAEESDQLLGFIAILGDDLNKKRHSKYIAMGVRSDFQGKKIGSALMEAAIHFCSEQNASRIELTVMTTNLKAISLYKKFGFEIEGTRRNSLMVQGHLVDEYLMSKV